MATPDLFTTMTDPGLVDSFPLPPRPKANTPQLQRTTNPLEAPIITNTPPEAIEQYKSKPLPPLPPKFKTLVWGNRTSSLVPAPLAINNTHTPTAAITQPSSKPDHKPLEGDTEITDKNNSQSSPARKASITAPINKPISKLGPQDLRISLREDEVIQMITNKHSTRTSRKDPNSQIPRTFNRDCLYNKLLLEVQQPIGARHTTSYSVTPSKSPSPEPPIRTSMPPIHSPKPRRSFCAAQVMDIENISGHCLSAPMASTGRHSPSLTPGRWSPFPPSSPNPRIESQPVPFSIPKGDCTKVSETQPSLPPLEMGESMSFDAHSFNMSPAKPITERQRRDLIVTIMEPERNKGQDAPEGKEQEGIKKSLSTRRMGDNLAPISIPPPLAKRQYAQKPLFPPRQSIATPLTGVPTSMTDEAEYHGHNDANTAQVSLVSPSDNFAGVPTPLTDKSQIADDDTAAEVSHTSPLDNFANILEVDEPSRLAPNTAPLPQPQGSFFDHDNSSESDSGDNHHSGHRHMLSLSRFSSGGKRNASAPTPSTTTSQRTGGTESPTQLSPSPKRKTTEKRVSSFNFLSLKATPFTTCRDKRTSKDSLASIATTSSGRKYPWSAKELLGQISSPSLLPSSAGRAPLRPARPDDLGVPCRQTGIKEHLEPGENGLSTGISLPDLVGSRMGPLPLPTAPRFATTAEGGETTITTTISSGDNRHSFRSGSGSGWSSTGTGDGVDEVGASTAGTSPMERPGSGLGRYFGVGSVTSTPKAMYTPGVRLVSPGVIGGEDGGRGKGKEGGEDDTDKDVEGEKKGKGKWFLSAKERKVDGPDTPLPGMTVFKRVTGMQSSAERRREKMRNNIRVISEEGEITGVESGVPKSGNGVVTGGGGGEGGPNMVRRLSWRSSSWSLGKS